MSDLPPAEKRKFWIVFGIACAWVWAVAITALVDMTAGAYVCIPAGIYLLAFPFVLQRVVPDRDWFFGARKWWLVAAGRRSWRKPPIP